MNQVVLTGRLTRDPESRQLASGKTVTQFSVATNDYRGGSEKSEFHPVVTWDRLAEICAQYLGKPPVSVALPGLDRSHHRPPKSSPSVGEPYLWRCAMSAIESPTKISREILEDRYEGLFYEGVDPSKLQQRQWRLIQDILVGVARHTADDHGLWGGHDIESAVGAAIRETVIRLVDETGTARS